ncbi:MAG: hypothetical protein GXP62_21075, partial [Oligoflexia bacterium]|nr:hypothetical protein [Oligoflexia bacterium]
MSRWVDAARKWVARFTGGPAAVDGPQAGQPVTADGLSAVLAAEALMGTVPLQVGPSRQALAHAAGQALGGLRASAHVDGPDLLAAHDRLAWASGRSLPLVVQSTLGAAQGHASATGTGHGGWHAVAGAGCFQLIARDVQEAVDLTVVARAVAEAALVPGLVGMDREQTAMAIQTVRLPPPALIDAVIGRADDEIACVTDAQRQLFGQRRRRVPAWFDLARPALLGGTQGTEAYGLGAAARRPLIMEPLDDILATAMAEVSARTGRPLAPISSFMLDKADLVLVAQGSLAQILVAVVDHLRRTEKLRVGVVALTTLRPFPLAALRRALAGKRHVVVLERCDTPLAADGPLAAELRAALASGARLQSVVCGLGGLPIRAADVALLCRSAAQIERDRLYLGMDFVPAVSRYPRRQAALDALRRDHAELVGLGLRAGTDKPLDVRPSGSVTVQIVRPAGLLGLPAALAQTLQAAGVVQVRARPADEWLDNAVPRIDRLSFGPLDLLDSGDELPAELAVLCPPFAEPGSRPLNNLSSAGAVLIMAPGDDQEVLALLPAGLRARLTQMGLPTWVVDPGDGLADSLV